MGKRKDKKKKDKRKVKDILGDMSDKVRNAVQNLIQNAGQSITNVVSDVGNAAEWLALIPFKRGMVRMLKAKGIPVPKHIDEIAKQFFAHVIRRNQFEEYFSVHQAAVKLGRHSARVRNNFAVHHYEQTAQDENHMAAAVVGTAAMIIKSVVSWFMERKRRKEAGADLDNDEEAALNDYTVDVDAADGSQAPKDKGNPDAERDADGDGDDDDDESSSNTTLWTILIAALVVLVVIVIVVS